MCDNDKDDDDTDKNDDNDDNDQAGNLKHEKSWTHDIDKSIIKPTSVYIMKFGSIEKEETGYTIERVCIKTKI